MKISPLIEPLYYIKDNFELLKSTLDNHQTNYLLPNQNYLKTIKKINSKYNTCYIESLILYLFGKLVDNNICIHFPDITFHFMELKIISNI